ncbi:MAG: hypothetical protein WDM78_13135 [Puia sp.]
MFCQSVQAVTHLSVLEISAYRDFAQGSIIGYNLRMARRKKGYGNQDEGYYFLKYHVFS